MTNFDFLKKDKQFESFSDVAVSAEKVLHIDPALCVINCRRAMEFAVKWMYSVDGSLTTPWQDNLAALMSSEEFRDIVGNDVWNRMKIIRVIGNNAAHRSKKITEEEATLCLENIFIFLDLVAYYYAQEYEDHEFDASLISTHSETVTDNSVEINFEQLLKENEALKAELTARREEQQQTYVPKPLDISEYETRKIYIDYMLVDAGWFEGKDWLNEVELPGMPNNSEVGYADYVLYGADGKPLAVVEAKRT